MANITPKTLHGLADLGSEGHATTEAVKQPRAVGRDAGSSNLSGASRLSPVAQTQLTQLAGHNQYSKLMSSLKTSSGLASHMANITPKTPLGLTDLGSEGHAATEAVKHPQAVGSDAGSSNLLSGAPHLSLVVQTQLIQLAGHNQYSRLMNSLKTSSSSASHMADITPKTLRGFTDLDSEGHTATEAVKHPQVVGIDAGSSNLLSGAPRLSLVVQTQLIQLAGHNQYSKLMNSLKTSSSSASHMADITPTTLLGLTDLDSEGNAATEAVKHPQAVGSDAGSSNLLSGVPRLSLVVQTQLT